VRRRPLGPRGPSWLRRLRKISGWRVPRHEYERCKGYDREGEDGYREGEDTAHVHPLHNLAKASAIVRIVRHVTDDRPTRMCRPFVTVSTVDVKTLCLKYRRRQPAARQGGRRAWPRLVVMPERFEDFWARTAPVHSRRTPPPGVDLGGARNTQLRRAFSVCVAVKSAVATEVERQWILTGTVDVLLDGSARFELFDSHHIRTPGGN